MLHRVILSVIDTFREQIQLSSFDEQILSSYFICQSVPTNIKILFDHLDLN